MIGLFPDAVNYCRALLQSAIGFGVSETVFQIAVGIVGIENHQVRTETQCKCQAQCYQNKTNNFQ